MKIVGSKFQLTVWNKIKMVPRSKTLSYKHITKKITKYRLYRAVANAWAKNSLSIIIPCHSVIKQNYETGGYFKEQNSNKKKSLLIQELI